MNAWLPDARALGLGNPVLSLPEDLASATLVLFAFVVPVVAVLALIALVAAALLAWRRRWRRASA